MKITEDYSKCSSVHTVSKPSVALVRSSGVLYKQQTPFINHANKYSLSTVMAADGKKIKNNNTWKWKVNTLHLEAEKNSILYSLFLSRVIVFLHQDAHLVSMTSSLFSDDYHSPFTLNCTTCWDSVHKWIFSVSPNFTTNSKFSIFNTIGVRPQQIFDNSIKRLRYSQHSINTSPFV